MKLLIVLVIIFSGTSYAQENNFSKYHLVFDLDWTLLYQLKDGDIVKDESRVVTYEGQRFRVTDHAGKMIQALMENYKGINVSFYSGGAEERNLKVLESIKLPNGLTALDIYTNLYSRQDLELVSEAKDKPFAERYKKVLYNRINNYDGAKILLIDDLLKFSDYRGTNFEIQEIKNRLNTLFSFGRISFYEDKPDFKNKEPKLHDPTTESHWYLERNKTALMYGIISQALTMEINGEGSFSDNAVRLHRDPKTLKPYDITNSSLENLFEIGFEQFNEYSKTKQYYPRQNKQRKLHKAPMCKNMVGAT